MDEVKLLKIIASLESKSTHPIAKAFLDYLEENKLEKLDVKEFENLNGYGIIGKIENENIILGNKKILSKYNIENKYEEDENRLASQR